MLPQKYSLRGGNRDLGPQIVFALPPALGAQVTRLSKCRRFFRRRIAEQSGADRACGKFAERVTSSHPKDSAFLGTEMTSIIYATTTWDLTRKAATFLMMHYAVIGINT